MCNESRKSFFAIISRSTSDIGDLGLVLTGTTRAIHQKKIAEIGSLDREIIFQIIGSGRIGPPKIVIRSDPFGTLATIELEMGRSTTMASGEADTGVS